MGVKNQELTKKERRMHATFRDISGNPLSLSLNDDL